MRPLARTFLALAVGAFIASAAHARPLGVVASASPEATAAGVEILEAGGNAIDAAVAVQFALAVTEPAMSGLGGGTQMIVHPPEGAPYVINGSTFAPAGVPPDASPAELRVGWTASTVPSTVKVFDVAWRKHGGGRLGWDRLLAPSIRYAEDGFVVGPFRAKVYERHEKDLAADPTAAGLFLRRDGRAPKLGDVVRQPILARTLRRLAAAGGEDFYTGEIAQEIAKDMAANGGWITAADLAAVPEPKVSPPLMTSYRGYDVYTLTPPAGGWVVLQALNLLEAMPADLHAEGLSRTSALIAALRLAHGLRQAAPVADLVNYQADIAAKISKETAAALLAASAREGGETTHFTVVDGEGMVVSVTTSIDSYFGARRASPTLGFLYNNYMQAFELGDPRHPFALKPGGMPFSSMSAAVVAKDARPVLGLGSPGSARIISAVTQVATHWVDVGAGVEAAVAAPRVHVVPNEPNDDVYIEARQVPLALLGVLSRQGVNLQRARGDLEIDGRNAYFGGVHAVALEAGRWRGAADPRRDGTVGYAKSKPAPRN